MGETSDGSSSAAQGAQDSEGSSNKSLFERLFGTFGGDDDDDAQDEVNGHSDNDVAQVFAPDGHMGHLRRMRVDDVAIPRAEIVSVPVDIELPDLVEVFRESGLTRLPVYDGTLDNPLGLVHLKDLALKHGFTSDGPTFGLSGMVRPLIYAPPSMPIAVLLQKMQTDRQHMALVIDEYGGVDGLVTIEDLIEQIIGEITDEHDIEEDKFWTVEKPGVYLAQARTPLEDFEAEIGCKLVEGEDVEEVDTLGGLVFMLTGRVPARGEVITHPAGADFEIVEADPRRIQRLRVRYPAPRGV
ncbi:magnesium/cobalt efflux protein [Maritimibacter sp. 55A14]|uniref:hemolysin family protein n=1 Tax=Maritimibacter sp. 55A14 TaxID=2174844 RepID=UPI000D6145DB|nr:hemolysin family protein [Maritimibacter sp. 55A14]PWE31340.1 magnesium/cobalt efflux protein [Maritimibacter sp. 55A14]